MACRTIVAGPGMTAIACTRGTQRPSCSTPGCANRADKQCDFPVKRGGKAGTCDRHICSKCAVSAGRNVDHCPAHARLEASK